MYGAPSGRKFKEWPKLTEEQQELVERNIQLVYGFVNKYHSDMIGDEDYLQELRIILCKAASKFDPIKAKFSTYAYVWFSTYHREQNTHTMRKRHGVAADFSLDFEIGSDGDSDDSKQLYDRIPDHRSEEMFEETIDQVAVGQVMEGIKSRNMQIFYWYSKGKTQKQLGTAFKVSQVQICRILKEVREKIKEGLIS